MSCAQVNVYTLATELGLLAQRRVPLQQEQQAYRLLNRLAELGLLARDGERGAESVICVGEHESRKCTKKRTANARVHSFA